ncbi:YdcF family protein [Bradyrhizobium sp. ISRA443]|uniref:YdcF family protein n=1 Tax=unclassified Bradyrhizobium TaxID=2631580 RepID=UPI00247A40ED|nr:MULTISPECIES: YdcF family protein [unclassified Bradyrhizobium]WGR91900.1 YdcF family protein [Bradyrhizobium sp. ISRA435]WGS02283.1 YdcF family protein [Bradyrhizobium sp. ISRA436]WGS09168.1 YdcF family protein [Bradyrhizobium sp. ISRA437]WGS16057.1 YdcF family protein [Bradyrhizobium sp. ISRA443]
MFFVLSKTLGIMLLPINLLLGIGLIGVILLPTRFAALGRRLMAASLVLLTICAFSPLGNILLYGLEQRFPPWDASRGAPDGIIVLGGSIEPDLSVAHGTPVVRSAPDRIIAAAALALKYPNARLVFTGGSANLISNDAREADYAGEIFESLGIPKSRLIIERRSRNTVENAEFSKALLDPKPSERWLLVTSAYHMPRSVGLFRRAGFNVEAYPVDWRVGNVFSFATLAVEGMSRTDLGMREWIGLVAYRLTGRIDDLLPGPVAR